MNQIPVQCKFAIMLVVLLGNASEGIGKEPSIEKAWERNWKQVERHEVLELGGMNTKKAALRALPFWLGQTGIIARMDREKLRYVVTQVTKGSPSDGLVKEGDELVGANGKAFDRPTWTTATQRATRSVGFGDRGGLRVAIPRLLPAT